MSNTPPAPTLGEPHWEVVHISDLTVQEPGENARLHNPRNIGMIVDSLQEVGAGRSVVIDENNHLMAGSGTTEAFAQAGMEKVLIVDADGDTLVAVRRRGLTDDQKVRLALADNRTQETSFWDTQVISKLYVSSPQLLEGLFTTPEIDGLLASVSASGSDGEVEGRDAGGGGDEFDDTQAAPTRVKYGDIWQVGPHVLMCGDSTDPDHMQALMAHSGTPTLLVTSPPYGVGKEYEGETGVDEWLSLMDGVFSNCVTVCPTWFVNLANRRTGNEGYEAHTFGMLVNLFETFDFNLISLRMWAKDSPAWSSTAPYWRHTYKPVDDYEFLGLFGSEKPTYQNRLSQDENNEWGYRGVWHFNSVQSNAAHPAAYPIELPSRAIRMLTDVGDWVVDPFLGSGTSLVTAHRLRRMCAGMDVMPKYCDLALLRAEAEGIGPITLIENALMNQAIGR